MSHLMKYVNKLVNRSEQLTVNASATDDGKQAKRPASQSKEKEGGQWWILEPPTLTVVDLLGDLKLLWQKEFLDAPWHKKIAFSMLRIIQHLAYRQGYGDEEVIAQIPVTYHLDFSVMEKNLEQIPSDKRMTWLHSFLGHVNNPGKEKNLRLLTLVIFELSNTCNYNCIGCERGKNGVESNRFMDVENLRRWAAMACRDAHLIRINGMGEAAIHPRLFECLDILKNYPGGREIITNGSAPLEVYERLLADGFVILISWDASEAKLFEKIRFGADFESMKQKLPCIADAAKKHEAMEPVLLFTLRQQNMNQLESTLNLARESNITRLTVNMFKCSDNSDWTIPYRRQIHEIFQKAEEQALALNIDLALPDHIGNESFQSVCSHASFARCPFPYEQVVIRYNGEVTPCNMMNPYVYGSIAKTDFSTIWNGIEAQVFREMSRTSSHHPYCSYCYYVPNRGKCQNQEKQAKLDLLSTGKGVL